MLIVLSNRSTIRKSEPQRSKLRAPRETLYPSRPLLGPLLPCFILPSRACLTLIVFATWACARS